MLRTFRTRITRGKKQQVTNFCRKCTQLRALCAQPSPWPLTQACFHRPRSKRVQLKHSLWRSIRSVKAPAKVSLRTSRRQILRSVRRVKQRCARTSPIVSPLTKGLTRGSSLTPSSPPNLSPSAKTHPWEPTLTCTRLSLNEWLVGKTKIFRFSTPLEVIEASGLPCHGMKVSIFMSRCTSMGWSEGSDA